jgi:Phage integrase family
MKRSQTICIVNSHFEHREVRPDAAFSRGLDGVVCEQVGVRWLHFQKAVQLGLEGPAVNEASEECVIPSIAILGCRGKRGLSRQFHQLMHDVDGDRRRVTNPAGRKFAKRSFHSLRHTFVSDLANSGSNPEIWRKLSGHKTASVHDVYTHFERETLRAAVHAIPSLAEL